MSCNAFPCEGISLIQSIGGGGSGEVFMASDEQENIVAVKQVKEDLYVTYMEFALQNSMRHPNILSFHKLIAFQTSINIVMEYVPMGFVDFVFESHSFDERIKVMHKILKGLACIHQNGIVHCDIKPGNIQMRVTQTDDGVVVDPVIIDFGLSIPVVSVITGRKLNRVKGTFDCLPPQMLDDPPSTLYNDKVDIWGFGMVSLVLFTGRDIYPDGMYCGEDQHACFTHIQRVMNFGTLLDHIMQIVKDHKLCHMDPNSEKLLAAFLSVTLAIPPLHRPSAQRLLKTPLFKHLTTNAKECQHITPRVNALPIQANRIRHAAVEIARLYLGFREVTLESGKMEMHLFYWTIDLMYLYFSHPLVDLEGMSDAYFNAYIIAFISLIVSTDEYFLNSTSIDVLIQSLQYKHELITYDLIEALKPVISVTLNGHIWRRFLYESIRTKDDLENSYRLIYNPVEYLKYTPMSIDPLNEESPSFWKDMSIMDIQLPK